MKRRPYPVIVVFLLILGGPAWAFGSQNPKIAAIQLITGSTFTDATNLVEQAGDDDADLVILPMDFAALEPQDANGFVFKNLSFLSVKYDMYIVAPIPETFDGYLFNTALLISPDDVTAPAGIYRQTHVSSEDESMGVTAGMQLPVFDTRFGKIGVLLGYDLSFRETSRILALRGAELLLYCYEGDLSGEIQPEILLGEAAFFDANYIAMAGLVEPAGDGASGILGLDGRPLTVAGYGNCVVDAIINLQIIVPYCLSAYSREKMFACRDPFAVTDLTDPFVSVIDQSPDSVTIACIQAANLDWSHIQDLLHQAGALGADLVVTQEAGLPNDFNLPIENNIPAVDTLKVIAAKYNMTIVGGITLGIKNYPKLLRSSYVIIGPDGNLVGVHYQHTGYPADDFQLFDTGFGDFGCLVCWDLIVMGPEYARVEAIQGARLLVFGTLAITEESHDLVLPSLAKSNVIPIAFSAAAHDSFDFQQAGVVAADGTYLQGSVYENRPGDEVILRTIELALPGNLVEYKQQLLDDRRPELYTPLIQSDICLSPNEVTIKPEIPVPGEPVVVTAVTYNTFFPLTAAYDLRLSINGQAQDSVRVAYRRWGLSQFRGWDFGYHYLESKFSWIATEGMHAVTIEADSYEEIEELREDNNRVDIIIGDASGVDELPAAAVLQADFPNPFKPQTPIRFRLGKSGKVKLAIYDLQGRMITVLADGGFIEGDCSVVWNGRDSKDRVQNNGIYFVQFKAGQFELTKKLVLIR